MRVFKDIQNFNYLQAKRLEPARPNGTEYTQNKDDLLHLIHKTNVARASAGGNIKADCKNTGPPIFDLMTFTCHALIRGPYLTANPTPLHKRNWYLMSNKAPTASGEGNLS
jgi:hypothetical protein